MSRQLTYAQALNEALSEELEADPNVFLIGEDIGQYGGVFGVTKGLQERFGRERIRDTPISETAILGCAVGAAILGKRPVVEVMWVDFTLVGLDQIINQAAKLHYMLGVIPQEAAREIRSCCRVDVLDMETLQKEIKRTAHPLVPVIRALAAVCGGGAGEFLHWGATTQDVTDTATVLLIRDALELIEARLDRVVHLLAGLARNHKSTPMVGRTHGQHALPITLGFKFAILLSEYLRHRERLKQARERVLVGQLAGAVGSLASLDSTGIETQRRLMLRLGLGQPVISWHTSRDSLVEVIAILSMIAATTGKIANEVRTLQRTEIAELEEPYAYGKIGSSTMPHKRNPMICENIVASSRITRQSTALALDAMHQENERDMTAWGIEWEVIPETFVLVAGALEQCAWVLEGLRINEQAMTRNLAMLDGLLLSEAVMMALAPKIGRQEAHDLVYAASMNAYDAGRPAADLLRQDPRIASLLSEAALADLLDPTRYLGLSTAFVDRVLALVADPDAPRPIEAAQ